MSHLKCEMFSTFMLEPDLHKRGAEMLELDVHLSQDEHVVVAHDQVPNPGLFLATLVALHFTPVSE